MSWRYVLHADGTVIEAHTLDLFGSARVEMT